MNSCSLFLEKLLVRQTQTGGSEAQNICVVIAVQDNIAVKLETLNASNANSGKQLAPLLEISRFSSSAVALFIGTGISMLTPKAAG